MILLAKLPIALLCTGLYVSGVHGRDEQKEAQAAAKGAKIAKSLVHYPTRDMFFPRLVHGYTTSEEPQAFYEAAIEEFFDEKSGVRSFLEKVGSSKVQPGDHPLDIEQFYRNVRNTERSSQSGFFRRILDRVRSFVAGIIYPDRSLPTPIADSRRSVVIKILNFVLDTIRGIPELAVDPQIVDEWKKYLLEHIKPPREKEHYVFLEKTYRALVHFVFLGPLRVEKTVVQQHGFYRDIKQVFDYIRSRTRQKTQHLDPAIYQTWATENRFFDELESRFKLSDIKDTQRTAVFQLACSSILRAVYMVDIYTAKTEREKPRRSTPRNEKANEEDSTASSPSDVVLFTGELKPSPDEKGSEFAKDRLRQIHTIYGDASSERNPAAR